MTITTQDFDNAERDLKTVSATSNSRDPDTLVPINNYSTRLGGQVDTLVGRLAKLGYLPPLDYVPAIIFSLNDNTKTIEREGFIYAPLPSELPFTTSGNWATDSASFFVVQNSVKAGAQFADVISMKAGIAFGSSTPINFANYIGQKVSTVVNNTISNKGGKDYIITNVNPSNLSTLAGGVWVGANHDLGGGYYAEIVKESILDPMTFGVIPYALGESTSAFVELWQYLRVSSIDDYIPKVILAHSILIDNPPLEHFTAAFVCNFPIDWVSNNGCHIECRNVSSEWVFQMGTYNAFSVIKMDHFSVRDDDGTCNNGVRWCDKFSGSLDINHCASDLFVNGIGQEVLNVQDARCKGFRAFGCDKPFSFADGNQVRADGAKGSPTIVSTTGPTYNTNCTWELIGQASLTGGLVLAGGDNMEFNGVIQDTTGNVLFDIISSTSAGSQIELGTLYLETSSASKQELIVRSAFTGTILLRNLHGSSIGANATFEAGDYSVNCTNAGGWQGKWFIGDGVRMVSNASPLSGYFPGSNRPALLENYRPDAAGDITTDGDLRMPQNREYTVRNNVPAGSFVTIFQQGNNSSFADTIGVEITLMHREAATGRKGITKAYINLIAGGTPSKTILEYGQSLTSSGGDILAVRVPSSPNDQLRVRVSAVGANDLYFVAFVKVLEI